MWDLIPGIWKLWGVMGGMGIMGLAILAILFPAFGAIIRTVVDAISPLVVAVGKVAADILSWVWENILWKGIKDIAEDWPTVATVGLAAYIGWIYMEAKAKVQMVPVERQLNACIQQTKKLNKTAADLQKQLKVKIQSPWGW